MTKNAATSDLLPTISSMETMPLASIGLPPHTVQHQVGLHELIVLPSKLLEHEIRHQVGGSAAIDKYPRNWPPVIVTSNV
jgi:hypothetical protein